MQLFHIFWQLIAPQKKYFFGAMFFRFCQDMIGWIWAPMVFSWIVGLMTDFSGENRILADADFWKLFGLIVSLHIVAFTFCARFFDYFWMTAEFHLLQNAKRWCVEKVFPKGMDFFEENFAGSTLAKINRFSSLEQVLSGFLHDLFPIIVQTVAILAIVSYLHLSLGIVFFLFITIFTGGVFYISRYIRFPAGIQESAANSKTSAYIVDALSNMMLIKSSSAEDKEKNRIFDAIFAEAKARRKVDFIWLWNNVFQSISVTVFELTLIFFFFYAWQNHQLTVAEIVLIHSYAAQIFVKLWGISSVINRFSRAISDAWEMLNVTQKPESIKNPQNPEKLHKGNGKIVFENVSFAYKNTSHPSPFPTIWGEGTGKNIFENFSLEIPAGKKIGLVGSSGAGKSTFAKLLLRFSDPISGKILIDGQNISHLLQEDVRKKIAFVPQDPALLHRTIAENIAFSAENFSEKDFENAVKNSFVDEFLKDIPEGKNALVGERGVKLSGGQRQRIAIARAFLKNSPIVLLDEATSALDSESEAKIQESFDRLFVGKTVIAIAHRLSTLKKMDEIWVLENGKIVEKGTHEELLAHNGIFQKLWEHQSSGFLGNA